MNSYDCGIETNRDAWTAVHDAMRDGLTRLEICKRTGLSYQMTGVYARQAAPSSTLRRINSHHEGARLCACGRAMSSGGGGRRRTTKCVDCERRIVRDEADVDGRSMRLRSWALIKGRVPTSAESRDILHIGRSQAAEALRVAFGPDPRNGSARYTSYRGWPDGAPDVPRPDMVDVLHRRYA